MAILPIPTGRVSSQLLRTRLVQQTQSDQLDLFRIQSQLSTGRRIFQPSDDAPSALRAITLQRSLERRTQIQVNLNSAQASLTNAENSLDGVGEVLNSIRASALSVAGTVPSDSERGAIRTDVLEAIDTLVNFGNSSFQDSFLFSGSRALTAPFIASDAFVEYVGDETSLQQRVDVGVLFDTNIPGSEVFGGLSEPVRGSTDLNRQVSSDTLLSDLNNGDGVTPGGSIEIAYIPPGTALESESVIIDLSTARTVGDAARLIEAGGPPSAGLRVSVTGSGLTIETEPEALSPGQIVVREVASGETAEELGVLTSAPATTVVGGDLDPLIGLTTRLDTLLGTRSQGRVSLGGPNNDLLLTASANGDAFNGVEVSLVDGTGTGTTLGGESASYTDGAPPTLVVSIVPGATTAAQVADAINAEGTFTAAIDFRDASSPAEAGTEAITAASVGITVGTTDTSGGGTSLDLAAGLQITNGQGPVTIDTSSAETVEDLLNLLNRPENGVLAEINASRTGIDVRTRRSGADFTIGENGGTLATQLGLRTLTTDSRLEDFNRGTGVVFGPEFSSNEFTITVSDAGSVQTYTIDLDGDPLTTSDDARTVQDVLARIARDTGGALDADGNIIANGAVTASLATSGNGITLTSTAGVVPPTPATSPPVTFGADTLTFSATTPGAAGNQNDFSIEIRNDSPGTGRSTTVVGNTIVVELDGTTPTAGVLAGEINAELASVGSDFTISQVGDASDVISAPEGPTTFITAGGDDGSPAGADLITVSGDAAQRLGFDVTRTNALGAVELEGDTLTFAADPAGLAAGDLGNQDFTIEVRNDDPGAGSRSTTVNGNTIVVELGGTTPTTAEIAADIDAQLAGFTVTSNGSPPATVSAAVATQNFSASGGFDADTAVPPQGSITSADVNTIEVDSVFNSLIRLAEALRGGVDAVPEIGRAIDRLDVDLDRATSARGELGARLQSLNSLEVRLQDEEVELRATLSEEIEVDFTQAVSDFTARQFALQASLQTTANLLQLTVLNFI